MTKGTYFNHTKITYEQRFIMCLQSQNHKISLVLIESTTNQVQFGTFQDSEQFLQLKKVLVETKPLEVVYNQELLDPEILFILKTCFFKP